MHLSRQGNCRSLRCSWSIACRRCDNYIFILDLTPGLKGLGKDDFKTRWESFKFWGFVASYIRDFTIYSIKYGHGFVVLCFVVVMLLCIVGSYDSFTHLPLDKMDTILHTTFSNAFSWMKSIVFRFKFHWSLFQRAQLTMILHWFRWWLGAE